SRPLASPTTGSRRPARSRAGRLRAGRGGASAGVCLSRGGAGREMTRPRGPVVDRPAGPRLNTPPNATDLSCHLFPLPFFGGRADFAGTAGRCAGAAAAGPRRGPAAGGLYACRGGPCGGRLRGAVGRTGGFGIDTGGCGAGGLATCGPTDLGTAPSILGDAFGGPTGVVRGGRSTFDWGNLGVTAGLVRGGNSALGCGTF